jgi:hypothetical protein
MSEQEMLVLSAKDRDRLKVLHEVRQGATDLGGGVFSNEGMFILENVSFMGHQHFTDPAPAVAPRQYRVDSQLRETKGT